MSNPELTQTASEQAAEMIWPTRPPPVWSVRSSGKDLLVLLNGNDITSEINHMTMRYNAETRHMAIEVLMRGSVSFVEVEIETGGAP